MLSMFLFDPLWSGRYLSYDIGKWINAHGADCSIEI